MIAESFSLSVLLCSQAQTLDTSHIYQIKIFREAPSGDPMCLVRIIKCPVINFLTSTSFILRLRESKWGDFRYRKCKRINLIDIQVFTKLVSKKQNGALARQSALTLTVCHQVQPRLISAPGKLLSDRSKYQI